VKDRRVCGLCHPQNPEWEADAHSQFRRESPFLTMYGGTDVKGADEPDDEARRCGQGLAAQSHKTVLRARFKLDYPNRAGNCAACHTPLASKISNIQNCGWSGCHTDLTAERSQGIVPPAPSPMKLTGDAAEGITCRFLHKIGDVLSRFEDQAAAARYAPAS